MHLILDAQLKTLNGWRPQEAGHKDSSRHALTQHHAAIKLERQLTFAFRTVGAG